jgi:K+-sensing histidine kinase KdpD
MEAVGLDAMQSPITRPHRPGQRARDAAAQKVAAAFVRLSAGADMAKDRLALLRLFARVMLFPLVGVGLTTALLVTVLENSALKFELIIFLIPVVICAIRWGLGSALVCVAASAAVADFFFLPPVYSFAISDPNQIVELALFLFVAIVTSNLAARLKNEADATREREQEIHNLYEFSRRLALCSTASDLVKAIQEYLSVHLGCAAYLISVTPKFDEPGVAERTAVPELIEREARDMIAAREPGSRLVVEPDKQCLWVLKSVVTKMSDHGVLAVDLGKQPDHDASEVNDRIDSLLSEASATLTRIDAVAALANANVRLESDVLKTALIGTASHELRSPVAAILGSTSVLDQMPALRANSTMRSLVDGMHREAQRLDTDIQNLLDTVRITDSGIKPHLVWTDPADIFAAAIRQRSHRVAAHKLKVDIHPALPLLNIDPVLLEQAVGQIIENAAKYSPGGSDIAIVARAERGHVVLSVTDQGVGLTNEEASQLFRRAVRGRRHVGSIPGLGLGLWIARIFVTANGGSLSADSAGAGRGTTMSIRLPVRDDVALTEAAEADAQTH